jgi:hypothetical protein
MAAAQTAAHRAMPLRESLSPYHGPIARGVDTTTLYRKVMCGYQGWFMARGDGYPPGFVHWGDVDRPQPSCTVDLWPDVSELGADEKFPTNYRHADGSTAYVFSSTVAKTVDRHFRWMKDYGIDGAFVQRFTAYVEDQHGWNYQRACAVLHHCRAAANRHGRAYAVMYDTPFTTTALAALRADWSRLLAEMRVTADPAYLRHRGGPLVVLWGYGFPERGFDAADVEALFQYLKWPEGGGCTIMLGVPNDWVTWSGDRRRLVEKYVTVVSPWTVGRYHDAASAREFFAAHWPADLAWCKARGKDYYAVAFPGFSWTNLKRGRGPLDEIPRRRGELFWSQIEAIKRYGMQMAYVAMFDEVDEGTAIFKCTSNPPLGQFCTLEGLPSDYYLRLAGAAGKYLRGERAAMKPTGKGTVDERR